MKTHKNINEYIKDVPKEFLPQIKEVRAIANKLIPEGQESIKYGIPTIELDGKNFIHFAAMKGHLGFYPTPSGVKAFEDEFKKKGTSFSKGCIRFPYDKPLPTSLITKIIKFRLQEEKAVMTIPKINKDIKDYNKALTKVDREICDVLAQEITGALKKSENKIWHAHPVWFLNGNPVVGYSKLKGNVRLLFWSGQSFDEKDLQNEGSFKAAEARYTEVSQIKKKDLRRWLKKAQDIQWDYKNIVKKRGVLEMITK